jgi:hypothetical protein
MAVSSSKMLQIPRKTGRKADPKKMPKTEKNNSQNNSGPIFIHPLDKLFTATLFQHFF